MLCDSRTSVSLKKNIIKQVKHFSWLTAQMKKKVVRSDGQMQTEENITNVNHTGNNICICKASCF